MFEIEYKGGNTVVIATKKNKLITDPKQSVVGLKDLSSKDAVVLATEDRFATNDEAAALTIDGPGEYEVGDFSVRGIPMTRHIDTPEQPKLSTMYRVEIGDVRIGILGNIDAKLSEDQLEALGLLDILILPVGGGGYTLDATSAAQVVRLVEANTVIPVHYADRSLKYEVPQDELEVFVKELSAPIEALPKYKVKSQATLPSTLNIVELTRS